MIKQASSSFPSFQPERTSGEDTEREQMLHEICNTEAAVFSGDFYYQHQSESVIKASDEIGKAPVSTSLPMIFLWFPANFYRAVWKFCT